MPVLSAAVGAGRSELPETRDRASYYVELRAAVAADRHQAWDAAASRFAKMWAEHTSRWPGDAPASRRGSLDSATSAEVDRHCDRIRTIEARTVTPAMRRIEAQDPDRELVGLEHRRKTPDRLKEKVAAGMESKSYAADIALSVIPDSIRYTFCYSSESYVHGVRADIKRMVSEGFVPVDFRNTWTSDRYKGINSRWREPDSGQLFEVQFHTRASFEAKQLTHPAYERLRDPATTRAERRALDAFQSQVSANVPVPYQVTEIWEQSDG